MGNAQTGEYPSSNSVDLESIAKNAVVQTAVQRMIDAAVGNAASNAMEREKDRIRQLEDKALRGVHTLEDTLFDLRKQMKTTESRLLKLEQLNNRMEELEKRVGALEISIQTTIEAVIPKMEAFLEKVAQNLQADVSPEATAVADDVNSHSSRTAVQEGHIEPPDTSANVGPSSNNSFINVDPRPKDTSTNVDPPRNNTSTNVDPPRNNTSPNVVSPPTSTSGVGHNKNSTKDSRHLPNKKPPFNVNRRSPHNSKFTKVDPPFNNTYSNMHRPPFPNNTVPSSTSTDTLPNTRPFSESIPTGFSPAYSTSYQTSASHINSTPDAQRCYADSASYSSPTFTHPLRSESSGWTPSQCQPRKDKSVEKLHNAVKNGRVTEVHKLLKRNVNINARGRQGVTAVHLAAQSGNAEMLELLLVQGGAAADEADRQGRRALHWAAACGDVTGRCTKLLLEAGACYDGRPDSGGNTPLHVAAGQDHLEAAKALLAAGAKAGARNGQGATPLDLARSDCMCWLLSSGVVG